MKTQITKTDCCGWKNCVKISDGKTEAIISAAFGPRLLSLSYDGGENHLYLMPDTKGRHIPKDTFAFYGGHRCWSAPERADRNYFPDNAECDVKTDGNSVTVTAPVEKQTGTRRAIRLTLENGTLTLDDIIENRSLFDIEFSVWGITQLACGGKLVVPTSCPDSGLTANRAVAYWSYSSVTDKRIVWSDFDVSVQPTDENIPPFKFGLTAKEGRCTYCNFGQKVEIYSPYEEGVYPDYGCNFECYTGPSYIEAEFLTPIKRVGTGQSVSLTQYITVSRQ